MASIQEYDQAASEMRRPTKQPDGNLDARELIRYATLAASSHNTQPWKFRIRKNQITILPDFSRRCPVVDPDDSHLFKSLGCAAENLVHAAAAQGFSAEVQFDSAENAYACRSRVKWRGNYQTVYGHTGVDALQKSLMALRDESRNMHQATRPAFRHRARHSPYNSVEMPGNK